MNGSGYLLDTNVISETFRRARASAAVTAWLRQFRDSQMYVSVIALGEIRRGIERQRLKDPVKAVRIERWLEEICLQFRTRILDFGEQEADAWGRILPAESLPEADAMMAATALHHRLTIVTRNVKDFSRTGVATLNPWDFQP